MSTYTVQHLHTSQSHTRPSILINPHTTTSSTSQWPSTTQTDPIIEAFHKTLPAYNQTPLHPLPSLAADLGLKHVFLKDESTRFGLPAFKILGASWAIFRTLCQRLHLSPASTTLEQLTSILASTTTTDEQIRLVTCTEGNWGRACARMAKILSIPATVYVPGFMSRYTQDLLRSEGATVRVLQDGSYDDCIAATRRDADETGAMMVMDTSWDGYEEVPQWVTQGYTTMLTETDRQLAALTNGLRPNTLVCSVGVGSWAHAVVDHYKSQDKANRIVSVEPDTAACLKESLHMDELTSVATGHTIMAGMCCGTPSQIAWPVLRNGVHAAVTVTDPEAHRSVEFLTGQGLSAGPCGAATVAALRKFVADVGPEERKDMVVVLFSTEGRREYEVPSES